MRDLVAVDEDLPAVRRMRARQHAHQGRLAGAVAADEPDDLAGVEVDGHVPDGVDATEGDADVAHLDERRSLRDGHRLSPPQPVRSPVDG